MGLDIKGFSEDKQQKETCRCHAIERQATQIRAALTQVNYGYF